MSDIPKPPPAETSRPGEVDWDAVKGKVAADIKTCEQKQDTLSDYDKKEFLRFREMVNSGKKLNLRNIASLHKIATGSGAL